MTNNDHSQHENDSVYNDGDSANVRQPSTRLNQMMTERSLLLMVQERAKKGIKSFDMGKVTAREENSILNGFPQPVDSRFEPITGDLEIVTKHKNTKAAVIFKTVSKRNELWGPA